MTYIIIPNYTVSEELKQLAINTIEHFRKNSTDIKIIVVDDCSPMDSSFLDDYADVVLKNEENLGFAKTCNKGLRWVLNRTKKNHYVVCANNDIEVYPGWQEEMVYPFEKYDNVAVSGICHSMEREHNGVHLKDKKGTKIVDGGMAAVMQDGGLWMSTTDVLRKVGLFDEVYKIGGMEDVDLFLRMRDTYGMRIIMSERAWYWHKEGATRWSDNDYVPDFRLRNRNIEEENRAQFKQKWGYDYMSRNVWTTKELEG